MLLKEWFSKIRLSVSKFCGYHNLCQESISKYLKGQVPRVDVALKIVKATRGEVTLEDLGLDAEIIAKVKRRQQKIKEKIAKQRAKMMAEREASKRGQ